jgi:hypothetical protein
MVTESGSAQTADLERATAKKPEAGSQAISHSYPILRPRVIQKLPVSLYFYPL